MARVPLKKGLRNLKRKFDALPVQVQKRVERRAMAKVLEPIAEKARARAPKDTGKLASLIDYKIKGRKHRVIGTVGTFRKGEAGRNKPFDPWYGHFLEFGTSKQPAQPFLRPSFDRREALNKFVHELRGAMQRVRK